MASEGNIIDFEDSEIPDLGSSRPSSVKANFNDYFWGTDCRGFDVLLKNLKSSVTASHQLGEYIKERVSIERSYVKSLRKLSKSLNNVPDAGSSGFHPVWLVFLRTLDQVCINKDRQVNSLAELSKEILEYSSKQDDQMKNKMKGEIDLAGKTLSLYQSSLVTVRKSRRSYKQTCDDVVEQERDVERLRADPLREQELKKVEHKLKKTRVHMDHMMSDHQKAIEACNVRLKDFEENMAVACKKFQSLEEDHLGQMRVFMSRLAEVHSTSDIAIYREYKKLTEKMEAFPVDKLISMYAQIKGTGKIKPELLQFSPIEVDVIKLSRRGSLGNIEDVTQPQAPPTEDAAKETTSKRGLFRKEKKKRKKKKNKDDKASAANGNVTPQAPPTDSKEESFEVDEEGYRIRPKDADKIAKFSDDESSHDDSSDFESDSDDEPEKHLKNIKIKLKDEASVSSTATVDELSQVVKNIKLEALPSFGGIKKSGSSQSLDTTSSSQVAKSNISVDAHSLHDQLNDYSMPARDSPSPLSIASATSFDLASLPPPSALHPVVSTSSPALMQPNPSPISNASLPAWDISSPSTTPTAIQSTENWATFSSDFSSGFASPEPKKETDPQQLRNKSIDLGSIGGGNDSNGRKADDTSKLNKTLPPVPLLAPPPSNSNPNPTGSLFLPPPSNPSIGGRRRGTVDSTQQSPSLNNGRLTSSLSAFGDPSSPKSIQRPTSASSLDYVSPNSPLAKIHRTSKSNVSSPLSSRSAPVGVVIPFAVSFLETCHAIFKGSDYNEAVVKVTGQIDFSFPAGNVSQLESHEPLKFRLGNTSKIVKLLHNQNILTREGDDTFVFIMDKLHSQLKAGQESKKNLPFCNVQGLKYEVTCSESSFPLHLTSSWSCDQSTTLVKINYSYTPSVFPTNKKPFLSNGTITVTVGGGVTQHTLEPLGVWQSEKNLAGWKLEPLDPSNDPATGVLSGKFTVSAGPTTPSPAIVRFLCDGATLSGVSMALLSKNAYKISLTKNKCVAGKVLAEPST